MNNIFCDTLEYYFLSEKEALTVRYLVQMKDEVDGEKLRQALDLTMTRYPYLMKRIVADEQKYTLVPNELPVVVKNTDKPLTLCNAESNYHLFGLTYWGNTIYFNNTHALFDGRGRGPVLHTLMYYYCQMRYNEAVDMPGVILADTPIDPAEYYDPFTQPIPESEGLLPMPEIPEHALRLDQQGLVTRTDHAYLHHIRINEKQLMSLCKSSDGTPNTILSLLLSRAIDKLHPNSEEPIIGHVYCDYRHLLGAEKTHRNNITTLPLVFDQALREMPLDRQNTVLRGRMLHESDPSVMLNVIKGIKEECERVQNLPTLDEKINACIRGWDKLFDQVTFAISYSGKKSFGTCDQHIAAFFPDLDCPGFGILMEVTAADGWVYVAFLQSWCEDVYFNAFMKEIVKLGLDFDLLHSSEANAPKFSLR